MEGTLRRPNFKILSIFLGSWTPIQVKKIRQKCSRVKFATKLKDITFFIRNLYGGYPWNEKFQNSE
jgi:hypothetical protein